MKSKLTDAVHEVSEISKNITNTSKIIEIPLTYQYRPLQVERSPRQANSIAVWHDPDEINIACAYTDQNGCIVDPFPISIDINRTGAKSLIALANYIKEVGEQCAIENA